MPIDPREFTDVVFGLYRPISQLEDGTPEKVQEVILYVDKDGHVLEFDATYENKLEAQKVYNEMRALKYSGLNRK